MKKYLSLLILFLCFINDSLIDAGIRSSAKLKLLFLVLFIGSVGQFAFGNSYFITEVFSGFIINGKAYGFKDSTKLYLDYPEAGMGYDSAVIVNEKFIVKGKYPAGTTAMQVTLRTKNYSDYKYLWVEGGSINFSATKGNFKQAIISGSAAQEIQDKYTKWIQKENDALERLTLLTRRKPVKDSIQIQDSIQWLENRIHKELTVEFIITHPNSIVSAHLLETYGRIIGKTRTEELYNKLTASLKESQDGKSIKRFIDLNKDVGIGRQFVDIEQENHKGIKTKLSDNNDKYVLLEFWASRCGPCRRENPELVKMYHHFRPKGFEIYAVSVDQSRSMWLKAIEKDQLPWINVSELNGNLNSAVVTYGVYEYPTNFLIDRKGKILAKNLRGEQLRIKLKELLGD